MVGKVSRMRVSSMTRPSSSGTLKSTRMKMRWSFRGRSRIESLDMAGCPLGELKARVNQRDLKESGRRDAALPRLRRPALQTFAADVVDQVANPARVSPLVVVPRDDLDAGPADHQGH